MFILVNPDVSSNKTQGTRSTQMEGRLLEISHHQQSHITDHQIDWDVAEVISPIQVWHLRGIREAIEIQKNNIVPQDIGSHVSDIWVPLLPTNGLAIDHQVGSLDCFGSFVSLVPLGSPSSVSVCLYKLKVQ